MGQVDDNNLVKHGDTVIAYRIMENFGKGLATPEPLRLSIKGKLIDRGGTPEIIIKSFVKQKNREHEIDVHNIYKELDSLVARAVPYRLDNRCEWQVLPSNFMQWELAELENI